MMMIVNIIWSYVYWYLRPFIKWALRRMTKLCELQRICYGMVGSRRTCLLEYSLNSSRTTSLKALMKHLYKLSEEGKFHDSDADKLVECATHGIISIKKINSQLHQQFFNSFCISLDQILGYRQLIYEVEKARKIAFCSENIIHEEKLIRLWNLLIPDRKLDSRITRQWGEIGFQGDDPKTDFRGMGILGLDNLLFFASEYNSAARHVLSHSHNPKYGYSFAIVGINLTSIAYHFLIDGKLKNHLYNSIKGRADMIAFHQVYAYLFYEFDKFWLSEKPRDIMEFNRIRDKFTEAIQMKLLHPDVILKINLAVDII